MLLVKLLTEFVEECSDSDSTSKRTFGFGLTLDDFIEEFLLDKSSSDSELVDDCDDDAS